MVRVRCAYWGDYVPTYLSEVHVFPSRKRYYHCTYCTVSPYSFTHVSFMGNVIHTVPRNAKFCMSGTT